METAKKKILLVEDEIELVEMLRMRLEESDYQVRTALDGEQAFEAVKEERPDLVILDLMLPKIDGYKVCGLLKKDTRYAAVPIIIFSARAQASDIALGLEMGADAYITKPFDPDLLVGRIHDLLRASGEAEG